MYVSEKCLQLQQNSHANMYTSGNTLGYHRVVREGSIAVRALHSLTQGHM
jgi:hypothetical protein